MAGSVNENFLSDFGGVVLPSKRLYKLFIVPGNHISFLFLATWWSQVLAFLGLCLWTERKYRKIQVMWTAIPSRWEGKSFPATTAKLTHVASMFSFCVYVHQFGHVILHCLWWLHCCDYTVSQSTRVPAVYFSFFLHKSHCFHCCTIRQYCCCPLRTCCAKSID